MGSFPHNFNGSELAILHSISNYVAAWMHFKNFTIKLRDVRVCDDCLRIWNMVLYAQHSSAGHINLILLFIDSFFRFFLNKRNGNAVLS